MKAGAHTFRDQLLCTDGSVIGFYEREFYMFSNFSSFQVFWRDQLWPTSEHAYQAAKFSHNDEVSSQIHQAASAHDAYKLAGQYRDQRIDNWDDIKVDTMYDICKHKLQQHSYIREHLLSTGQETLVEDSPKDDFWGWGADRTGRNELGKIWMRLREELRGGKL